MIQEIESRFYSRYKIDLNGCWNWTARCTSFGYGIFWDGKSTKAAHRVAWANQKGEIPNGLKVLHKCDNPSCINVDHLFLGTSADNALDRDTKKRHAFGSRNGRAKINEDIVREIRLLASRGYTRSNIAKIYDITYEMVSNVINRKFWVHVD